MNYGPTKEKIPLSIMLSFKYYNGVQPGRASCWVQPQGSWASTEVLLGSHLGLALGPDGPNSTQFLVK